jgi:tetratricopeptide (TPR) repeat protein
MHSRILLLVLAVLLTPALADEGHQHAMPAGENFGTVHFATSCSAAAQPMFQRAFAILHSFGYEHARTAFEDVAKQDPQCAMAYWGVAMTHYRGLWEQMEFAEGAAAVAKAREIAQANTKTTARERGYLEAIANIFADQSKPLRERALAYELAMAKLHTDYPDDTEAAIFYALALDVNAPKGDKTYANQRKARDILVPIFEKQPNHPGPAHYIIHASDFPPLAAEALPAARRYAAIAPASAHAQHMPSHIFIRLGLWDEAIKSNRKSAAAAERDQKTARTNEAYNQRLHAMDYMEYGYLQLGRSVEARELLIEAQRIREKDGLNPIGGYADAAIPARFAVERRQWKEAAALPDPTGETYNDAMTWFAKGLGIGQMPPPANGNRLMDNTKLRNIVGKLYAIREKLAQKGDKFWSDQVEVQRLQLLAWAEMMEKDTDKALEHARAAADLEDATEKPPVTPGPIIPARENLANMLVAAGRPADALTEYEAVLKVAPNRLNAITGAVKTAEAAGEKQKAKDYRAKLGELRKTAKIGL